MKKRVIPAAIAAFILMCFAGCGGEKIMHDVSSSTVSSTVFQTMTETTATTASISSTTAFSSTAVQTVTETQATTTQKETTTAKPKITDVTTILPSYDENKPDGYYEKYQNVSRDNLRYGVSRRRNVISYIETLSDGTRVIVKQDISEYYNRYGYKADLGDLLPAARDNMEFYSDLINLELKIINSYRAAEGIAPLSLSEELTEIACARAEEIAWSGKHSHTRPNGKKFASILKEAGITEGIVGENIGWGYATVEDVCQAWKDSQSHYENIMNPDFVEIGIGIAADPDPDKLLCWTQIFINE